MAEVCNIGVLISGSGTNLQALIDASAAGAPYRIAKVVSSRPDAYGITRAEQAGIPVCVLNREAYADPRAADERIVAELNEAGVSYVAMAGYMRMVTSVLLEAFPNRIVNLHPALLPSFVGAHAIADAYEAGVKVTGVTVHFANEEYDKGPIIAQEPIIIEESDTLDTLEAKIHATEHVLFPKVIDLIARGCVSIDAAGRVHVVE